MEGLDKKKEALREVLKDVRNAHKLIFEYQRRVWALIKHIQDYINNSSITIHKFPCRDLSPLQYSAFTEIFWGSKEDDDYKNVFSIIVSTGRTENEKSEFIFILDAKGYVLKEENMEEREAYFVRIISENENILEELKEKGCVIQRRNIEDFYNEEALKREWEEISKAFPPCWINNYKRIGKEG